MSGEETFVGQVEQKKEFLSGEDKHALDLVKMKKALALANAEKALAQNEAAELYYNNLVLQLTFKYSLKEKDSITEQGEIVRSSKEGQ
jgi:hypothetical protein